MARSLRIRRNTAKKALLAGIEKAIDELFSAKYHLQNGNRKEFFDYLQDAVNTVTLIELGARGTHVTDLDEPTDAYGLVKEG